MGITELVLESGELTRLSVTCPRCNTVLTYDVSGDAMPNPNTQTCPGCPGDLGNLHDVIVAYKRFRAELVRSGALTVQFRVSLPVEE
jgi:hypothetical protein